MGRIILTAFTCILVSMYGQSQCPDLPNNVQVNGTNMQDFALCGTQSASFTVNDPNLPEGTIDWYSNPISGFDPLVNGNFLGASNITSAAAPCNQCPELEAILIDACGPGADEARNEFAVVGSGSGFDVDDFTFMFSLIIDPANNLTNDDINIGSCTWTSGNLSSFTGCSNLISAGPGDFIPPNSRVIVQTSLTMNVTYDVSALCTGDCIYVIRNSCDRQSPGFSNCTGSTATSGFRTTTIGLNSCGCTDDITYDLMSADIAAICPSPGMYVTPGPTYSTNGCNNGPTLGPVSNFPFSATTSPFNHTFSNTDCNTTQYIVGVLNSDQYNEECCGPEPILTEEYSFAISCATAELSGAGDLCPDECVEIDVIITGGTPDYELNLQLTGGLFPIPITLPSFPIDGKITICYDTGGPLVDPATNTVNVPSVAGGFSGGLVLQSFTDDDGCAGTINGGAVSISFNEGPNAITPAPLEACDLGDGTALFVLMDLDVIINGGTALGVQYFSDDMGINPITSPYQSPTSTVYAQVIDNPCNSEIIPIELIVVSNGDAGIVNLFCTQNGINGNECTICDDDGVLGEDVSVIVVFENPNIVYDFEIIWTALSGPSATITGSSVGGTATIPFTLTETTTFQVISVTKEGDCVDLTDLDVPVTLFYGQLPDMDNPGTITSCTPVMLPAITGNLVPSNASYYTMPGANGTPFSEGDLIVTSTTLYLYGGIDGCEQEFQITINIQGNSVIDDPGPVNACGSYALPPITGTNVDNANYYTETNGGGDLLPVGQVISATTQIFIFDPLCNSGEVVFTINITPGAIFTTGPDTTVCDTFIVETIEGIDLTGNQAYFEFPGGNGQQIMVNDTIAQDSTIYIYDNTPGCIIDIPFVINISKPQFPGRDSMITICEGDGTLYNINALLAGDSPDTTGVWIENGTSIITDSTTVSFASLSIGNYDFLYGINDPICGDTSATLSVNITGAANAGIDTLLAVCEDITGVDVYQLLGDPDQGGIFVDNTNTQATFDPLNASFTTDTPGLIVYNYIVGDPASSCGADTSIFSVITGTDIEAGQDGSFTLCAGEVLLSTSLLNGNSAIGIFSEPTVSGGLEVTGNFNSALVPDGEYTVYHILAGSGQCPDDTATFIITVVDGPSAGDEQEITICGAETIDIETLLDPAADGNGTFYLGGTEIVNTTVDFTGVSGTQDYIYVVGNGISCPFDTAEITIMVSEQPTIAIDIDNNSLCTGECAEISISISSVINQDITTYFSIRDDQGNENIRTYIFIPGDTQLIIDLCEGIGNISDDIVTADQTYTITLDSMVAETDQCSFIINDVVMLTALPDVERDYIETLCTGGSVIIGPDTYDESNPTGITTLVANNGCDSIVNVDLTFLDVVTGSFVATECEGESVEILGITYTDSFSGDSLLVGASAGGCDSLVMIDITFLSDESVNRFFLACEGEVIPFGNQTFTELNPSGEVRVSGVATNGCDSVYNVLVTFGASSSGILDTMVCGGYSIDINGVTYDEANPTGMEILEGLNAIGCDSLLMIDLDFSAPSVDSTFTFATCDDDYFLVAGGEIFNRTNPIGMVSLDATDGECDTMLTIDITYGEMLVNYDIIDGSCEVPDTGLVIINEINGEAPYNLIYNGNNTIAFVLPVEVPLPFGTGEIMITDMGGCMSTIPYDIMQGNEDDDFLIIENGNQLNITGGVIDSVMWLPSDSISCLDCPDPVVNPSVTTEYTATVYYGGDCTIELSYIFNVVNDIPDYILPGIFSPNDDMMNDNFTLFITEGATGIPQSMNIYDRWGNRMAQIFGNDITQSGWDGTHNSNDVSAGVYVYHIQLIENERVINLYGDVTVIR